MDTRFWGPSGWRLLHLVSFAAQDIPFQKLYRFFEMLPYVLPCKFCRASITDYYFADPIPRHASEFKHWLYRIHNRVNSKLRDQKLLESSDPEWREVEKRYNDWLKAPCSTRRMIGWDFLFSVAYTTPCPAVASSPIHGAPPISTLPTDALKNRWGLLDREKRLIHIKQWWECLPAILPFVEWREAWKSNVPPLPSLKHGRKKITSWLYSAEKNMCAALQEESIHNSFIGLCSELSTFSSGCGKRSKKMKTCRAIKKHAKKTLKTRRTMKYKAIGGFL
jgi:hypothetical protein